MHTIRAWLTVRSGDADVQRRGQNVITLSLLLLGLIVAALPIISTRPEPLPSIIAILIGIALVGTSLVLARAGRVDLAGGTLVGCSLLAVAVPIMLRPEVSSTIFYLLLPIIITGLVLRPWQVWLVAGTALAIIAFDALRTDPALYAERITFDILVNAVLIITTLSVVAFIGARVNERGFSAAALARTEAEQAAMQLQAMNTNLENIIAARTEELRRALAEVEARAATQASLLAAIQAQEHMISELSVPVLPVRDDTLVLPLVGSLDSTRLNYLQDRALRAVEHTGARRLLLDITGVPVVDTQVAQGLMQVIQATRLLGAEPMLIGVRPEVAQTLVTLGIDLAHVRTAASLQSALG